MRSLFDQSNIRNGVNIQVIDIPTVVNEGAIAGIQTSVIPNLDLKAVQKLNARRNPGYC